MGNRWLGILNSSEIFKSTTGHQENSGEAAVQRFRHRPSSYSSWFSWRPQCRQFRTLSRLRAGPPERLAWLVVLAP